MSLASDVIMAGTHGAIPAAAATNNGKLYFETDTNKLFRSNGSTWVQVAAAADMVSGAAVGGWVADANTWTYSSADAPSYVISINADMTTVLSPGMRIKLTHAAATKYFIVTAVGSFVGGNTLVTVYGGTDYTLAGTAITNPYYSTAKLPQGFNGDPTKWSVVVSDTSDRAQASPNSANWYNLGSLSISIPVGAWHVVYQVAIEAARAAGSGIIPCTTLSTANNTESDTELSTWNKVTSATDFGVTVAREKDLVLASKTAYYLNARERNGSATSIDFRGDVSPTLIYATCAYL